MSEDKKLPTWREMPIGGLVLEGGTAARYETGDWRSLRPVRDADKCINCLLCWIYCPEAAIVVVDGKVVGIDLQHCKGCGICDKICPPKVNAIDMVSEREEEEVTV